MPNYVLNTVCCSSWQHEPGKMGPKHKVDRKSDTIKKKTLFMVSDNLYTLRVENNHPSKVYNPKNKPHVTRT